MCELSEAEDLRQEVTEAMHNAQAAVSALNEVIEILRAQKPKEDFGEPQVGDIVESGLWAGTGRIVAIAGELAWVRVLENGVLLTDRQERLRVVQRPPLPVGTPVLWEGQSALISASRLVTRNPLCVAYELCWTGGESTKELWRDQFEPLAWIGDDDG